MLTIEYKHSYTQTKDETDTIYRPISSVAQLATMNCA